MFSDSKKGGTDCSTL